ncbi:MAG: hypothetical protein GY874_04915 [Desulfobacteraceae bacterium]|nr:hypothetical protein [Desulfobacteraceae bacterium]
MPPLEAVPTKVVTALVLPLLLLLFTKYENHEIFNPSCASTIDSCSFCFELFAKEVKGKAISIVRGDARKFVLQKAIIMMPPLFLFLQKFRHHIII